MLSDNFRNNREKYRKMYTDMLGTDIFGKCEKPAEKSFVGSDDVCDIFRVILYVTPEIPFYAMLMIPHGAENAPLIISQHGGGGTPELCSDMNGKNNYNHMTQRALMHGAVVIAPQLLLWSRTEGETMRKHDIEYDRGKVDSELKRFGSSITALEIKGIMRCIDYACTLPCVNRDKIGMVGLSYGGYFALHTMAADTRIKASYCVAAFNDRDVYGFRDWCYKSSAELFQDAEVASLCAPRKLYIQVGKTDNVFDYQYALPEAERAEKYYKHLGAADNIRFSLWDGGHTLSDSDDGFDFIFSAFDD